MFSWIKVECTTPDKPEVHAIATLLGIPPEQVVGHLIRLWVWADQQSVTGTIVAAPDPTETPKPDPEKGVTQSPYTFAKQNHVIDDVARMPGFARAMKTVGWLKESSGKITFPGFALHNGKTAKQRALTYRRIKEFRAAQKQKKTSTAVENGNAVGVYVSQQEKEKEYSTPIVPTASAKRVLKIDPGLLFRFDTFWNAYPRKVAKPAALRAWVQLKPDTNLTTKIIDSVNAHCHTEQWLRDSGQYIPHPATFLNQRRFEDAPAAPARPGGDPFKGAT